MSFGFGISDFLTMGQLAWAAFDGAKRACGEHGELTREMASLVTVLDTVQSEISDPSSPVNMVRGSRRKELQNLIEECLRHVRQINTILAKYNSLSDAKRGQFLWQKVRFRNEGVKDIDQIRSKISMYTMAIHMSLTLLSLGSRGQAERQLSRQGGQLRGITESVNLLVAKMNTSSYEGSVWSKYTDDDVEFWRSFRRQLVKEGYKSRVIRSQKGLIQAYVRELESRGVLDAETKNSHSALNADSESKDSSLQEESASDPAGLQTGAKSSHEASQHGPEDVDVSGLSNFQPSWFEKEEYSSESQNYGQPTVEDFEHLSEFDRLQGEEPARSLDNNERVEEEAWLEEGILDKEPLSPYPSDTAHGSEYLEPQDREQQQQSMGSGDDTITGRIRGYNILPSLENGNCVKLRPSPYVDGHQAGVSGPSHVNGFQSVIIDNTSTTNEASGQDDDTPLDREASAKAREEAFNALSSKEKKVIITMLDPSGRKYPLPYFLVKTWQGMQYILEQAFLNIEGIGPRIAKAEYDLVNSDGAVIIPHLWETFVEPDMLVEVHIWPNSSPQMQSSLPTPESIPPVHPVPPPSPPTPQRHSPPPPSCHSSPPPRRSSPPPSRRSVPPPPPPPRSAAPRSYISVARRHRSTSRTSSHGSSSHKTSGKSVNWSLLWSPRPSKAKPKKWRPLPYSISLPPPPPYSSYESSYDDCTCWECRYTYIAYQQQPLEPGPSTSQFKVKYPQVTRDVVQTKSFKREAAECLESILEVEPIFEIEGEQIYELE